MKKDLQKFGAAFLYSLQLWTQDVISTKLVELKRDYFADVSVDESCNGNIWLTIEDGKRHVYIVGNTGCGCMHEQEFSGIDNIFDEICGAIDNYIANI